MMEHQSDGESLDGLDRHIVKTEEALSTEYAETNTSSTEHTSIGLKTEPSVEFFEDPEQKSKAMFIKQEVSEKPDCNLPDTDEMFAKPGVSKDVMSYTKQLEHQMFHENLLMLKEEEMSSNSQVINEQEKKFEPQIYCEPGLVKDDLSYTKQLEHLMFKEEIPILKEQHPSTEQSTSFQHSSCSTFGAGEFVSVIFSINIYYILYISHLI